MSIAASLDTNVLIRLLVNDDAQQQEAAIRALAHFTRYGGTVLVPITVSLELEWVLRSKYKFSKSEVLRTFFELLLTVELDFEAETALEQALVFFEEGKARFADCLHSALARKARALPFITFDVDASKLLGAKLIK